MPSGAKKRKALKKKQQQQESITNNQGFNGDNLHGIDEHGSQDDRESDGNLSSPASQGNEEFGTKDTSGMVKGAKEEISGLGPKNGNGIAVERGTDYQKNNVEEATSSSSENCTHTAKNVACGNSVSEIAPVVDSLKPVVSLSKAVVSEKDPPVVSVSKVVLSEKIKDVETSTHSNLVKQKSNGNEEKPSLALGKDNSKVVTLPRPAAETSNIVTSVRESEVPVSSDDKRLLLPGPPAVRTSWLSCCGLFDAMTGSDR